ncbi:MAG: DUF1062 domain-containing protein [Cohaesibacteraceae bacterium]
MAATLSVRWTLTPSHAPIPWRHCPTCATTRPFQSSGKIRLNANGRRLDAWLIYRCQICDQTWNRTLFERRPTQQLKAADHEALQHSSAHCVQAFEQDVAALRRDADQVELCEEVTVHKPAGLLSAPAPCTIDLALSVPHPTGCRLDRLLARELGLSRKQLQTGEKAGWLAIEGGGSKALRRPIGQDLTVRLQSAGLPASISLTGALFASTGPGG